MATLGGDHLDGPHPIADEEIGYGSVAAARYLLRWLDVRCSASAADGAAAIFVALTV